MSSTTLDAPFLEDRDDEVNNTGRNHRITAEYSRGNTFSSAGVRVPLLYKDCSAYLDKITVAGREVPTNTVTYVTTGTEGSSVLGCTFWFKDTCEEVPANMFKGITDLRRVDLKYSLRKIGDGAFSGIVRTDSSNVRSGCEFVLYDQYYEIDGRIFSNLEEIGEGVFQGSYFGNTGTNTSTGKFVLPGSVKSIGRNAFREITVNLPFILDCQPIFVDSYAFADVSFTTDVERSPFKMTFGQGCEIMENAFYGSGSQYGFEFIFDNAIIHPGAFNRIFMRGYGAKLIFRGTVNRATDISSIFINGGNVNESNVVYDLRFV